MKEKNEGLTRTIARFIVETDAKDIPADVYAHAKVAFLDWLGVIMAGTDDPLVGKLIQYADLMGGKEEATILGHGMKKSLSQAALINGAASHVLDYDDSSITMVGHPSVGMFPSLLALSEWNEKNGHDFLTAYEIGFKVGAVVGSCTGMDHYMAGWHATSTVGHFASAAVCSRLLGLNEQQTVYALGIAGTQAGGLKSAFGTMCKPFHAGNASRNGLTAALLAKEGFTASESILEGPDGFFQVAKGKINKEAVASFGRTWDIEKIAQKYHASCHATHSPIEGALAIVEKEGLSTDEIKSMKIYISPLAIGAAGKTEPKTALEGKFSIPYCVANALIRGNTGMQAFTDEKVNAPEIRELMKKISLEVDEKPASLEARIELETKAGKVYSRVTDIIKDIPELNVKEVKIKSKFVDLCDPVLGQKRTEELMEAALSLEKIESMKSIVELVHT
jgi:2-methylcitrate dehydratase PrpD